VTRVLTAAGVLGGAGTATLAYATLIERRWYALRHATVPVLRPAASRPLRLLHLSDLHLLPGQDDRVAFVRRCLALGPDMVVATGDLLGGPRAIDDVIELLGSAAADRPCLAVLGSNDHFAPRPKNPLHYLTKPDRRVLGEALDTGRLIAGLRGAGWSVIDNVRTPLDTVAGRMDVAGLGDPHMGADHPERIDWTPPSGAVALRLGVVHAPYLRALDVFDRAGFDLVLAGHTHGGQLRVPFVGALTSNCDLPLDQARGLSRHRRPPGSGGPHADPPWLHVSAGLGHSRYAPARFCCRPEATMLDLVPALVPPPGPRPSTARASASD
jgi:uncharacterized protein